MLFNEHSKHEWVNEILVVEYNCDQMYAGTCVVQGYTAIANEMQSCINNDWRSYVLMTRNVSFYSVVPQVCIHSKPSLIYKIALYSFDVNEKITYHIEFVEKPTLENRIFEESW